MPAKGFTHESPKNESFEWYTPKHVFDALGLRFDLDPCSPGAGKSFVPARHHYTIEDDGLTSPWFGTVWMNPPYGPLVRDWFERLARHGDGIALVCSRTDTRWFQESFDAVTAICFVSGRIKFYRGNLTDQPGSPGTGSMLVAFGEKAARAVEQSGLGACMRPSVRRDPVEKVA